MRVLVTGGRGFAGSHIVNHFRSITTKMGAQANEVFAPPSHLFDLTKRHDAHELFNQIPRLDAVIHCAAKVGGIGANRRNPVQFLVDNIRINTNTITAARFYGAKQFIALGSVCGYPADPPNIPFLETDYLGEMPEITNALYGYAKRVMLLHLRAELKQYGFNFIYLIPTNLYGPHADHGPNGHVVPAVIHKTHQAKITKNDTVTLWGSGESTRDFLHISDLVRAVALALFCDFGGLVANIGTGHEVRIKDLAEGIAAVTGYSGKFFWDTSKPDGQRRRVLDCARANALLKWTPTVALNHGIEDTYRAYLEDIE